MTIHVVVAIYDRAIDAYGRPFFTPTTAAAVRAFTDEIRNKESMMQHHPEDYDLYKLGTFDDNTGKFNNSEPEQLSLGKQAALKTNGS